MKEWIQKTTNWYFFLFFPENRIWNFMQIVSKGDNFRKRQSVFSGKNKKNISKCHLLKFYTTCYGLNQKVCWIFFFSSPQNRSCYWSESLSWEFKRESTFLYKKKTKKKTEFNLINAHAPRSVQSSDLVVFKLQPLYFLSTFFIETCCGYSFELPQKAIQTSTYNKCFYKENNIA